MIKAALGMTVALALLLPACKTTPEPSSERTAARRSASLRKELHVSRSPNSEISEDDADHMLSDASLILQVSEGAEDVECNLTLARNGDISVFDIGTGSVDTELDFARVCAQPGLIHVVERIGWCNGLLPNTWGCSQDETPNCIVVVRLFDPQLEAVLWAHEYGHTRGLPHRGGNDVVMHQAIESPHRKIDEIECDAYLEFRQGGQPSLAVPQPGSVRDFVHQLFIHGVPYRQAQQYSSPEDVQTLLSMLRDPAEETHWPNIAVTLGMVGNREVAQSLSAFIQQGEGVLSPQAYRAKTSALVAIGYVLSRHDMPDMISYLIRGARPSSWRNLNWTSPFARDSEARNVQLATNALLALGISGNPRAQEALRQLQSRQQFLRTETPPRLQEVLEEALKENQKAQMQGIEGYTLRQETARP